MAAELAGSYDVILMDFNMPGANGDEATKQILAKAPDAAIIGYSNSWQGLEKLYEAGALWVCNGSSMEKLRALMGRVSEGTIRDTDQALTVEF